MIVDRYRLLRTDTKRYKRRQLWLQVSRQLNKTYEYHLPPETPLHIAPFHMLACVAMLVTRFCYRVGRIGTVPRCRTSDGGSRARFIVSTF